MRPKTLAHDWCADANCETCSHRHKAESQPVRPTPAVGQVWRSEVGSLFLITLVNGFCEMMFYRPDGRLMPARGQVHETDVYVGQFAGFKIEEDGE